VFIAIILSVILLIINGIKAFIMKKQTRLSFVVHFVALTVFIICINCKLV
jgi:predicted PurR-regulated permease PerM